MADPLKLLLKAREVLSLIATWPHEKEATDPTIDDRMRAEASEGLRYLQYRAPETYYPYIPYLVDCADGVRGHYCIGRADENGTHYYWNQKSGAWASCCDTVLTKEEALVLLKSMEPTLKITNDLSSLR